MTLWNMPNNFRASLLRGEKLLKSARYRHNTTNVERQYFPSLIIMLAALILAYINYLNIF